MADLPRVVLCRSAPDLEELGGAHGLHLEAHGFDATREALRLERREGRMHACQRVTDSAQSIATGSKTGRYNYYSFHKIPTLKLVMEV